MEVPTLLLHFFGRFKEELANCVFVNVRNLAILARLVVGLPVLWHRITAALHLDHLSAEVDLIHNILERHGRRPRLQSIYWILSADNYLVRVQFVRMLLSSVVLGLLPRRLRLCIRSLTEWPGQTWPWLNPVENGTELDRAVDRRLHDGILYYHLIGPRSHLRLDPEVVLRIV